VVAGRTSGSPVSRGIGRWLRAGVASAAVALLGACAAASTTFASPPGPARVPATSAPACATTLTVVAHQDDDLLFINPAVSDDIAAGRCVVTVFVTAGDAGLGRSYWQRREQGPMAAYAAMAGSPARWQEDTVVVAGRSLTRRTLSGTRISLLFLRLPDAHSDPRHHQESLQRLWLGEIPTVRSLDTGTPYTRKALIKTLSTLMDRYQPDEIRTLDYAHPYGDGDHTDHHTVGYFTYAAQAGYPTPHRISGYLGYGVAARPPNLTDPVRDEKLAVFLTYAPNDRRVCQDAPACLTNSYAPRFSHSYLAASATNGLGLTTLTGPAAPPPAPGAS
jgi:LmbE family N-acetylglucosaminyl deacetylase